MRFTVGILTILLLGNARAGEVRVVPQGLVGVSFVGRESARVQPLTLAEARRKKSQVDAAVAGNASR